MAIMTQTENQLQVILVWHRSGEPTSRGRYLVELEPKFHEVLDYDQARGGWIPSPLPGRLVGWAPVPSLQSLPKCLGGAD